MSPSCIVSLRTLAYPHVFRICHRIILPKSIPLPRLVTYSTTCDTSIGLKDESEQGDEDVDSFSSGRRQRFTHASVDWISLALQQVGRDDVDSWNSKGRKGNLSIRADRERILRRDSRYDSVSSGRHNISDKARNTLNIRSPLQSREPSLQRILADSMVYHCMPGHKGSTIMSWDQRTLVKLGFSPAHVEAWARILLMADTEQALGEFARLHTKFGRRAAEILILLRLLRRREGKVSTRALRIALKQAEAIAEESSTERGRYAPNVLFMLFVRLLRHARVVCPSAIPNTADFLTSCLPSPDSIPSDAVADLTDFANSALQLVSLPSGIETFANFVYQESAMIKILEFMAANKLHLNRAGYRAVVRIQLAKPRTDEERRWDQLKALSWPPWKEDKTQVDSLITRDTHGISRAMNTLMQMEAVGYAPYVWEAAAKVYAGWDSDGTPTIQYRFLLGTKSYDSMLWAARITTTRTAQEAWAAFLAWQDEQNSSSSAVIEAIIRKLHEEQRRLVRENYIKWRNGAESNAITPGEQREINPPPPSTHLYTYTRTPPPSAHKLYMQLRSQGVTMQPGCVAVLVANASSLQDGLNYLVDNRESIPEMRTLYPKNFTNWARPHSDGFRKVLKAYIEILCRFPHRVLPDDLQPEPHRPIWLLDMKVIRTTGFVAALELYSRWQQPTSQSWLLLMGSLENRRTLHSIPLIFGWGGQPTDFIRAVTALRILHDVFDMRKMPSIEAEIASLLYLSNAHVNATVAAWLALVGDLRTPNGAPPETSEFEAAKLLYLSRPKEELDLKGLFWNTINSAAENGRVFDDTIPLTAVPSPAVIHGYIRAIGWRGDHSALVDMLRWAGRHYARLAERAEGERNGQSMLRKCVVAVRVFMERSFLPSTMSSKFTKESGEVEKALEKLEQPAPEKLLQQAKDLVESVEGLGGWPSDESVMEYISIGRSVNPIRRLRNVYEPPEEQ